MGRNAASWVAQSRYSHETTAQWRGQSQQSDSERAVTESDDYAELGQKKKWQRIVAMCTVVKGWVTGDRAEQPEEEIVWEHSEHLRHLMHLSWLNMPSRHKDLEDDHAWT